MVYSGCSVTYGTAVAVVTATGMDTEMGRIANLLDNADDSQTPLQKKLAQLGKYLGVLALAACGIIFVVGLVNGIPPLEIFMTAVSLAVSAIPEGLPAIVTVVLSIGVQRMVRKNALIRRLPGCGNPGQCLGHLLGQDRHPDPEPHDPGKGLCGRSARRRRHQRHRTPNRYAICCSMPACAVTALWYSMTARYSTSATPPKPPLCLPPTKTACPRKPWSSSIPVVAELPFDSDRKLMTTVHQIDGQYVVIVKGAFDMMASTVRCR